MKEFFLRNASLKIIALAAALLFWFIMLGLQNAPHEFDSTFEIKPFNLSEQFTVVGALPQAKIKILVDKDIERQLRKEDFEVYVDLKNIEPGKLTSAVYVTSKNPKVTVVSVVPDSLTMTIEKKAQKEMAIEYEVTGKVKDGFQLKGVKIDPEKIMLMGAASTLNAIKKIKTMISFDGTESKSLELSHITLLDQAGKPLQGIKTSPDSIDAIIDIVSTQEEKTVPVKPKFIGSLKTGFVSKITVHPNAVNIRGDIKNLEFVTGLETEPIDLEKISKTGTYLTTLILPHDIHATTGNRIEVYIEVTEINTKDTTIK